MKKRLFILVFTIMNYFVINAQVSVDTLSLWNCELLNYSGIITFHPKEYEAVMTPFLQRERTWQ